MLLFRKQLKAKEKKFRKVCHRAASGVKTGLRAAWLVCRNEALATNELRTSLSHAWTSPTVLNFKTPITELLAL